MAISIGAVATFTSNATSVTVDKPSGVVEGDLMVAQVVASDSGATITPPAGWNEIQSGVPASAGPVMASYYKVAGASEGSNYQFSGTSSTPRTAGIVRITGGIVVSNSSEQYNDTPSTTATGATVTPTAANSYLLFLVGHTSASASSVSSYAIATDNPTWTELWDTSDSTTAYAAMAYASRPQTTATGSATATLGQSVRSSVHILVIKESPIVTATDTTTITDTATALKGVFVAAIDSLAVTDTITTIVNKVFNLAKNISTWVNGDKN